MLHGVGYAFVVGRAAFERASRMLGDCGKIGMLPSKLRISEWPSSAICPLCPWGYYAVAVQQRNDAMGKMQTEPLTSIANDKFVGSRRRAPRDHGRMAI